MWHIFKPGYIHALRYKTDQAGIWERYLRESGNWQSHLNNTKQTILEICDKPQINKIAFLGSGWLLDIPTEALLKKNKKLVCFDIIHPKEIVYKYRNQNIEFRQCDFTCGLSEFFFQNRKKMQNGIFPAYEKFCFHTISLHDFDMVVSVNLLTQIDTLLIDYLKNYNIFSDDHISKIRTMLQNQHLSVLPENKTILVTEYEELRINRKGETAAVVPLIYTTLPEEKIIKSWKWMFDQHYSYYKEFNVILNVAAFFL